MVQVKFLARKHLVMDALNPSNLLILLILRIFVDEHFSLDRQQYLYDCHENAEQKNGNHQNICGSSRMKSNPYMQMSFKHPA